MAKPLTIHQLTDGWTFKQAQDEGEDAWLPVKRVPTNVHLDLIDNGKYVITWRVLENSLQRMTDPDARIEFRIHF
jgi:hypothetical protein